MKCLEFLAGRKTFLKLKKNLSIQGAKGEFSSKLCKNEKNTDIISLYQIYLLKLHDILKYNRLDLFKEIGFNHGLQMTLETHASLSDGFLV